MQDSCAPLQQQPQQQVIIVYRYKRRHTCCCGCHIQSWAIFLAVCLVIVQCLEWYRVFFGPYISATFPNFKILRSPIFDGVVAGFNVYTTFIIGLYITSIVKQNQCLLWPLRIHYVFLCLVFAVASVVLATYTLFTLWEFYSHSMYIEDERKIVANVGFFSKKRWKFFESKMSNKIKGFNSTLLLCVSLILFITCLFNFWLYMLVTRYQKYLRDRIETKIFTSVPVQV